MSHKIALSALVWFLLAAVVGCVGPKGDSGPMGPSGSNSSNQSPVYVFNDDFDSATYASVNSEWMAAGFLNGMTASLDSLAYVSANRSLRVGGCVQYGQHFYSQPGIVAYTPVNGDYYCDFYFNPAGTTATNRPIEITFSDGNQTLVELGFVRGAPDTFYTYNGGSLVTLESVPATPPFHHVVMVFHGTNGLSAYYIDGSLMADGMDSRRSIPSDWSASPWFGFAFPSGFACEYFNIDSLKIYHY